MNVSNKIIGAMEVFTTIQAGIHSEIDSAISFVWKKSQFENRIARNAKSTRKYMNAIEKKPQKIKTGTQLRSYLTQTLAPPPSHFYILNRNRLISKSNCETIKGRYERICEDVAQILMDWVGAHFENPYPSPFVPSLKNYFTGASDLIYCRAGFEKPR